MLTASRVLGDQVGPAAPVFLAFLAIHVVAGLTAVATEAVAALARNGLVIFALTGWLTGETGRRRAAGRRVAGAMPPGTRPRADLP